MHYTYIAAGDRNEFADFIESLTEDEFNKLLQNIPKEITGRDVQEFSTFDGVRAKDLRAAIEAVP
jgi:hypothetical protein